MSLAAGGWLATVTVAWGRSSSIPGPERAGSPLPALITPSATAVGESTRFARPPLAPTSGPAGSDGPGIVGTGLPMRAIKSTDLWLMIQHISMAFGDRL